jgi:sugar phosphate isomerase/epimerase
MYRRKAALVVLAAAVVTAACVSPSFAQEQRRMRGFHPPTDAYDGWRLGMQAYTFNRFTFYEAVDKTASLGLDWIEAYPGQKLSADTGDMKTDHNMSAEAIELMKAKLQDAGIRLINYGVVGLPNNEAECRKVFDWAKEMSIRTIVSEPPADAFELIDKLCQEYEINVAIHNHPKPSPYWDPATVLKVCEGRSERIGACADTGHWVRSGLDPVECLKKLEGRIISCHFKELQDSHDVPWGQGENRATALLNELHRQGYSGSFSIEYEYNWLNSVPEIRQCVAFFNKLGNELKPGGWQDLMAADLSDCTLKEGAWTYADGILARNGGGDIWTKETYGDFMLDVEFKVDPKTNSGVFIRTADIKDCVQTGIEIQIHDSFGAEPGKYSCGAVYDCLAPEKNTTKKAGEWNHLTVMAMGSRLVVTMNNERIISMNLDEWTEAGKNPALTPGAEPVKNKFNTAYKDMARTGAVGFQDHGNPVWYRNMKIRKVDMSQRRFGRQ